MFGSFAVLVAGAAVAPGAPTIGTATATSTTTATVSFTQPAFNGGAIITSYTATSSPSGITGTLSQAGSGTITVSGLTTGTAYIHYVEGSIRAFITFGGNRIGQPFGFSTTANGSLQYTAKFTNGDVYF